MNIHFKWFNSFQVRSIRNALLRKRSPLASALPKRVSSFNFVILLMTRVSRHRAHDMTRCSRHRVERVNFPADARFHDPLSSAVGTLPDMRRWRCHSDRPVCRRTGRKDRTECLGMKFVPSGCMIDWTVTDNYKRSELIERSSWKYLKSNFYWGLCLKKSCAKPSFKNSGFLFAIQQWMLL